MHVTMLGFGEAGRAFNEGFRSEGQGAGRAYDVKAADGHSGREAMLAAFAAAGVEGFAAPGPALAGAEAVFCLVTADQALAAAEVAAPHLPAGAFWFDGNSCSPGTKRRAAEVIGAVGGRYVDMAIMAPVHPKLHRTPVLLAGPDVEAGAELLGRLGMSFKVMGEAVGDASSIKMLRSVMIKGMEALVAECFLAARKAGVEEKVLASLEASDPDIQWRKRGAYNLERMRVHGARRASELREVAATLRELGLPDRMSAATAQWEDDLAGMASPDDTLMVQLDAVLEQMGR